MGKKISYEHVDVFTQVPLKGNQLAVFRSPGKISKQLMASIANEINFSETVFLFPSASAAADARARIFTPAGEIPFAGHPVIGAVFVIYSNMKGKKPSEINLEIEAGIMKVEISKKGKAVLFTMNQPVPEFGPALRDAGQAAAAIGLKMYQMVGGGVVSNGLSFLVVEAESEDAVREASLNIEQASRVIDDHHVSGIYLFARVEGKRKKNIHSRFFAPTLSVIEDPATGSAAGALGGYLARIFKFPKSFNLKIEQGVEMGRPSSIGVSVTCAMSSVESVKVSGNAVLAGSGTILTP
jgi:trans-2,3-dihydro-3-hydroxyanthranilate isomerase